MIKGAKFAFETSFEEESLKLHEPHYSQYQMDTALHQQYHQGYEEGVAEALASIHARNEAQLQLIQADLQQLIKGQQAIKGRLHQEIGDICLGIATTLFREVGNKVAASEVEAFLETLKPELEKHPTLTVSVHPDTCAQLAEKLKDLQESLAEKVSVTFHENPDLSPADCEVIWDEGGVSQLKERAFSVIEEAVQRYKNQPPQESQDNTVDTYDKETTE